MNEKRLVAVKKAILEEPKRVNMGIWGYGGRTGKTAPACGIVGCIAGWAEVLKRPRLLAGNVAVDSINKALQGAETNARFTLGLTSEQADRLFYVQNWPEKYRYAYRTAETRSPVKAHEARQVLLAQVVADRIDHFIATKGKE